MLKDNNNRYHHIHCCPGDVGRYVLLPGDPARADRIAQYFDNPVLIAQNRELRTWTGTLDGVPVSVTSTGMGAPSVSIAVEELICCGADTFIRVGTAGRVCEAAMDPSLIGSITTAAVRDEGTSLQYIPAGYPAVADRRVVSALVDAASELKLPFIEGIAHSKDSFYSQVFPESVPLGEKLSAEMDCWKKGNVMCTENEAAALFVISSIRRCRAGGIMSFPDTKVPEPIDCAIRIACGALRRLIAMDKSKTL